MDYDETQLLLVDEDVFRTGISDPLCGCQLEAESVSLSLTSPTLCPFGFLPHSNDQMAVSLRCEFRRSSYGETVCQTVCYTVRSHVLSLRVLTL